LARTRKQACRSRGLRGNLQDELALFVSLGLDGAFTDDSDIGIATRTELPRRRR
jgi:hypothetical protein